MFTNDKAKIRRLIKEYVQLYMEASDDPTVPPSKATMLPPSYGRKPIGWAHSAANIEADEEEINLRGNDPKRNKFVQVRNYLSKSGKSFNVNDLMRYISQFDEVELFELSPQQIAKSFMNEIDKLFFCDRSTKHTFPVTMLRFYNFKITFIYCT